MPSFMNHEADTIVNRSSIVLKQSMNRRCSASCALSLLLHFASQAFKAASANIDKKCLLVVQSQRLQCKIFKQAMKLEFAKAAAVEVPEQRRKGVNGDKLLRNGVNGDKLHVDLHASEGCQIGMDLVRAWDHHCSGMTDGIQKGYKNAGALQAFIVDHQRQLYREIDAGLLFADMCSDVLDGLTNDTYAEVFDGVSSMLDDDPAITVWDLETILLRKPRMEDESALPAVITGSHEDQEA